MHLRQAATYYATARMPEYAINCFEILHPLYERLTGWNAIQYQLYRNLAGNGLPANQVTYIKNLVELAH
jgi:adenylosuccinate synthase